LERSLLKISRYIDEAMRLWDSNPELVKSRQFFDIWHTLEQPEPFFIDKVRFKVQGIPIQLIAQCRDKVAYFEWNEEFQCAAIVIETEPDPVRVFIQFDHGGPVIQQVVKGASNQLSETGTLIELIHHVIASCKREDPDCSLLKMPRNLFIEKVASFNNEYSRELIAQIKKMKLTEIRGLIKKAASDMARDELSPQLSLSLGGNYATGHDGMGDQKLPIICEIPQRAEWSIRKEIEFLIYSVSAHIQYEQEYLLDLSSAEIIDGEKNIKSNEIAIKITIDPNLYCPEDNVLVLYRKDDPTGIGLLHVDLADNNKLYGRIHSKQLAEFVSSMDNFYARSRKHPRDFIVESFQKGLHYIQSDSEEASLAFQSAIGSSAIKLSYDYIPGAPEELDSSQKIAWSVAVDERNPASIIQGPPGTGKSFVLEKVIRQLVKAGKRIVFTAPSNLAVDTILLKIKDLPFIRCTSVQFGIDPELRDYWSGSPEAFARFTKKRVEFKGGGVWAGTHLGLLLTPQVQSEVEYRGVFDVIIYDEAGMSRMEEFFLTTQLARRFVLFGDHKQLPPFPPLRPVLDDLKKHFSAIPKAYWELIKISPLEWLEKYRRFPIILLTSSYRCQNPRLLRFSSVLFYQGEVKTSQNAEYFQLAFNERQEKFPPSTLVFFRTSQLPFEIKKETLSFSKGKPGIENRLEIQLCLREFYNRLNKYPLHEITIITPYKRQVKRIRELLDHKKVEEIRHEKINDEQWERYLYSRIATVDSFQGCESDVTIISYVRSNQKGGIGFVEDHNRINVAHTRCRKELVIIGDLECLKSQAGTAVFSRMERAFTLDGTIVDVSLEEATAMLKSPEP